MFNWIGRLFKRLNWRKKKELAGMGASLEFLINIEALKSIEGIFEDKDAIQKKSDNLPVDNELVKS
jgi:hypothetical protein